MKPSIIVLVALLATLASSKPLFAKNDFKPTTVDDIKMYIVAAFEGLDLAGKINPTPECISSSDKALNFAVAGIDNIQLKNYYEGALNISDSLGALSPLARQCDKAITDLATLIQGYPNQFSSILDFFLKLGLNLLGNVKPLLDRSLFVYHEIKGQGNTTAVVQTIAEMLKIEFTINDVIKNPIMSDDKESTVKFTFDDPLAPTPVPTLLWNIYESVYSLLVTSRFIGTENLVGCEGATLNLLLFNVDASDNFKKNKSKEGILSVLDSFTFLHKSIESCTNTAIEIGKRSSLVDEKVFSNPSIMWKNFVDNIFYVFSDGIFAYSETYYISKIIAIF